jgi:hypothetical protein
MVPLPCRWSPATATSGRNRSFSSQISPDQGRQRMPSSPRRQGAHRDPFPRHVISRRSQAEASRVIVRHFFDWPDRDMQRHSQSKPAPSSSPARHCREGCDGATATRELSRCSCSYPDQSKTSEEGLPIADAREHRIQSGRSGILASNRAGRQGFSAAARAAEGRSEWVLGGEGSAAHDEGERPAEGVLGKD